MDKHNFAPGKITKCQICGSKNLINIMTLGNQPLANSLVKNVNNENEIKKFPINIIRCEDCTLLQIDCSQSNEVYHMDYPYLPEYQQLIKSKSNYQMIFMVKFKD